MLHAYHKRLLSEDYGVVEFQQLNSLSEVNNLLTDAYDYLPWLKFKTPTLNKLEFINLDIAQK